MRGRPWTQTEDAFLRECAHARIRAEEIGPLIDRTPGTVRMRRRKLGLPPPSGHIKRYIMPKHTGVSVSEIKRVVAEHFETPLYEMNSSIRRVEVARPRQVAMFFAREIAHKSYPKIGSLFDRDHTTVIHGIRQVERLMSEDVAFAEDVTTIKTQLVDNSQKVAFVAESTGA